MRKKTIEKNGVYRVLAFDEDLPLFVTIANLTEGMVLWYSL
jgi:hypothetical protein